MFLRLYYIICCVPVCWCFTNTVNLIYFKENRTAGELLEVHQEIPRGAQNATKIAFKDEIPILRNINKTLSWSINLKILLMDYCEINDMEPGAFAQLQPTLEKLSLSHNNLKIIKEGVFNYANIKHLNLSYNKITTVKAQAFNNMPILTTLILDHNEISFYSIAFEHSPKTMRVSMKYNFIDEIPSNAFTAIKHNKINVYFSYNKIHKLHPETFHMDELGEIFLNYNELKDVNNTFAFIGQTEWLNLDGNHLTCMPSEFLAKSIFKLKVLTVVDNPLSCECFKDITSTKYKGVKRVLNEPENC